MISVNTKKQKNNFFNRFIAKPRLALAGERNLIFFFALGAFVIGAGDARARGAGAVRAPPAEKAVELYSGCDSRNEDNEYNDEGLRHWVTSAEIRGYG